MIINNVSDESTLRSWLRNFMHLDLAKQMAEGMRAAYPIHLG
jgi:hypothetical protein